MNAIVDPAGRPAESWRQEALSQSEPADGTVFTLRRTGRKPVRFEGWQLIEAVGAPLAANGQTDPTSNNHVRHDLNIYRTVKGGIVVELIARRSSPEHQDLFRVKTFEDLSGAAAWLEGHHASEDVPIPAHLGSTDAGLTWAVLQAVQLRQSIERIEANYHALLSEVFAALELTDTADV
jgi:hypothetical protein